MSFSRAAYDPCAYDQKVKSSQGPGEYKLNSPTDDPCMVYAPESGAMSAGGGSRFHKKDLIDVDSELLGLTRKFTKCKRPYEQGSLVTKQPLMFSKCKEDLESENTRLSNPPCTLRCNGVNRWESLCQNPQVTAIRPFTSLINNRIIVKDNHRPCIEQPLDQTFALPPSKNNDVNMSPKWKTPGEHTNIRTLPNNYTTKCGYADYFGKL